MNIVFTVLILICVIPFAFLLFLRKGIRMALVPAAVLLCVAVSASGTDRDEGRKDEPVTTNNYRLKKEAPAGMERSAPEGPGPEKYFPLYGSREERIFKPWLEVFSYRGGRGFRLNVDYNREPPDEE